MSEMSEEAQGTVVEAVAQEGGAITESAPAAPEPVSLLGSEVAETVETKSEVTLEVKAGGDGKVVTEVKPAEHPKAEGETKEEVKPEGDAKEVNEPLPLPTYEAFTLPEGVKADEGRLGEFSKLLGEFENLKADHTGYQQFGQKLVDFHVAEVQRQMEALNKSYSEYWANQKTKWAEEFKSDPDIGGKRWESTLSAADKFIRTHGGSAEEQKQIRDLLSSSGLGNHTRIIGLFAKAMSGMQEGKPLPAQQPVPAKLSKIAKMYGKK
jgi:hypothetical protein